MRTIVVLAVVLSAAVGLVSSDGAEPGQPATIPNAVPSRGVSPPPVSPYSPPGIVTFQPGQPNLPSSGQPPVYTVWQPSETQLGHNQITQLRQEYVAMAKKRAERMDGAELQKEIAELRCQWLIGELTALGSEYDDVRAGVAVMVLKAKDKQELKKLFRSILDEMDDEKPSAEKLPGNLTPAPTVQKLD